MKRHFFRLILATAFCAGSALQAQTAYEPYNFTVFAGTVGATGSTDATGSAARFTSPSGMDVDTAGNLFVADTGNNTIRKITPAGVVTTFAGLAGATGSTDATGSAARFDAPIGIAVDSSNNVYVADSGNNTIRKITPAGVVTTLAGTPGPPGSTDGTGSAALFNGPRSVAVDSSFNVYVADTFNDTIRKITSGGVVTTLAGLAGNPGGSNGTGSSARFNLPKGVAVDSGGNVYVGDTFNQAIRKVTPGGVVTTFAGAIGSIGSSDGSASAARFFGPTALTVKSTGDIFVADTNNATIRRIRPSGSVTTVGGLAGAPGSANGAGSVARFTAPQGVAVNAAGQLYVGDTGNDTIRLGAPPSGLLFNISTRASVQTGDRVTIGGFAISGTVGKPVLVRGLGPTLGQPPFSISGSLQDPMLDLHDSSSSIMTNDDWQQAANEAQIPANLRPPDSRESAILITLQPANYTAILSGKNGTSGIGLVEVYDLDTSVQAELTNVSTRGFVGTGNAVMIGGFITTGGDGSTEVLVRALGPTLGQPPFSIPGTLADPNITLVDANGVVVMSNNNWKDSQQTVIEATGFAPPNDLESAMLLTLANGSYTAIVQGNSGGTGIALVEVYKIQ